jgi:DNA-binding response OmpR family regulator
MKRVLIVEDHADIRSLIRLSLELEDLDVHEAENGDVGWEMAPLLRPDLMLVDVMMPGDLDGFALCRQVKSDTALRDTKVVMLTALGQDSYREEGRAAGADGYVVKPFSPVLLVEAVKAQLGC